MATLTTFSILAKDEQEMDAIVKWLTKERIEKDLPIAILFDKGSMEVEVDVTSHSLLSKTQFFELIRGLDDRFCTSLSL